MKAYTRWRLTNNKYAYIVDEDCKQPFIYNVQLSSRTYYDGTESSEPVSGQTIQTLANNISYLTYKTLFEQMSEMISEYNIHLLDVSKYYDTSDDVCSINDSNSDGACCQTVNPISIERNEFKGVFDGDVISEGTSWEDIFIALFRGERKDVVLPSITISPSSATYYEEVGTRKILSFDISKTNGIIYNDTTPIIQNDKWVDDSDSISLYDNESKKQLAYAQSATMTYDITKVENKLSYMISASSQYNASDSNPNGKTFGEGTATASTTCNVYGIYPIYLNFTGSVNSNNYVCSSTSISLTDDTKEKFVSKTATNKVTITTPDMITSTYGFKFSIPSGWTISSIETSQSPSSESSIQIKIPCEITNFTQCQSSIEGYVMYKMNDNSRHIGSTKFIITFDKYNYEK